MTVTSTSTSTRTRRAPRTLGRWIRRILGLLAAVAIVAGLVVAYLPKPVPVETSKVRREAMRVTVDDDGRARVRDRYVVSAPLAGSMARIDLEPGDPIEQGQVLARVVPATPALLDDRTKAEAEARVLAAEAARRQAASGLERAKLAESHAKDEAAKAKALLGEGAIPKAAADLAAFELDVRVAERSSAELAVQIAAHDVAMAKAVLRRFDDKKGAGESFEITAPAKGRVLRVLQESAGPVAPGTPLIELGDPVALEIVVDVLTSDAVRIQPGARVSLERWGGEPLSGHVRVVEPSAFTRLSALGVEEQRVNVVIDLDDPPSKWGRLGDGFRVEARIVVWEKDEVVCVPPGAVFKRGEGWAVFVFEAGKARVVPIETGQRNGRCVEALGGVDAGAEVVVHPSDRVVDGGAVEVRVL